VKRVEITKTTQSLVKRAGKDTVVLTRRGKPVAALVHVDPDQWEDWVVSTHPDFIEIIKRSEARYRAEGGISMDKIRRKYGLRRGPVRKAG
jgi:antitoxin (DNA-binding transcriptional repressor) of toxin-antitoxin stability system